MAICPWLLFVMTSISSPSRNPIDNNRIRELMPELRRDLDDTGRALLAEALS